MNTIGHMEIYPYKFKSIFKERIWGGRKLAEHFGKNLPDGVKIGESWELADLPQDKSEIINGPLAGLTIDQVVARHGVYITGNPDYEPPLPLLVKILDANDVLSVQVHPDAETCRKMGRGDAKTECWYIMAAEPQAVIYKGLKKSTTRSQFAKAIADGTCAEYLEQVPVKPGECHLLPSGTCHAIGAGLLIAEIQQPSDTTYRVFDWNRVDPKTNKARDLHVAEAMESIHFDQSGDNLSVNTVGRLVETAEFRVDKGHQLAGGEVLVSEGVMKVLIILTGRGKIEGLEGTGVEIVEYRAGETLLIPAGFEGVMTFGGDTEYLTISA